MALTPGESQQLATLAQEVTGLNNTVEDVLDLVRTAGQGGAVDIATHNQDVDAHTAMTAAKYPYLTADTNFYLSTTGSDANDGRTPETAKGSWAGMHALLASIDPREYVAMVNISGLFAGAFNINLPAYTQEKLYLFGTDRAVDGCTGDLTAVSGGFAYNNIRCGALQVLRSAHIGRATSGANFIRITGMPTPSGAIYAGFGGRITARLDTIEYSGAFTDFIQAHGGGVVSFRNMTYAPIGTPTFSGDSINMYLGSSADVDNPAILPGGGTITRSNPGNINAYGVAVAGGFINGNGSLGSPSFGITAVTKTQTGVSQIDHSSSFIGPIATAWDNSPSGASFMLNVQRSSATRSYVYTFDAVSNAPIDAPCYFFAF
jgi:hypothetical protein